MTKKEIFKNDILMAMKYHLKTDQMAILENVLSEALYKVELVEVKTLPATIDMTNEYIMSLYELKKGSRLSPETMRAYMVTFKEFMRFIDKSILQVTQEDVGYYLRTKFKAGNSNTSLNNKRRKLNSLFEWIRKQGLIVRNPVEGTEAPPVAIRTFSAVNVRFPALIRKRPVREDTGPPRNSVPKEYSAEDVFRGSMAVQAVPQRIRYPLARQRSVSASRTCRAERESGNTLPSSRTKDGTPRLRKVRIVLSFAWVYSTVRIFFPASWY